MKIIVCVKQLANGELNPFDASALELALELEPEKVTVVTMGPARARGLLEDLTRRGPVEAVLITGKEFAGADTLATSRTLARWFADQEYDLILCGRQSVDGETAQVGPELAELLGLPLVMRAMGIGRLPGQRIVCETREERIETALPALITVERSRQLRFPSLWAAAGEVRTVDGRQLELPAERCGLAGSPTRVIESRENQAGRRSCHMILPSELRSVIDGLLAKADVEVPEKAAAEEMSGGRLATCWITSELLREMAETLAEQVSLVPCGETAEFCRLAETEKPEAILFPADWHSRGIAPAVAARLGTGLCADCTKLIVEEGELHMIRPAQEGNLVAKIRCLTKPAMATVRTAGCAEEEVILSVGKGAAEHLDEIRGWAELLGAEVAASRACVEQGTLPYESQVGLTGKTVSPKLYIALGISGAVHHIVGMERAKYVIAVNRDRNAPIFRYADYGICCDVEELLKSVGLHHKS